MDFRVFEERRLYLEGHEEGVDFLDTLMAYVETALDLDTPEEKFGPLGTWQDTKPASSLLDSPAGPQEKSLMDKLNDLYPLDQPKIPTKNGYKVMPPWSVPMPWNFDKERDIFDNYAAIPLYLQGMTIRVDWPTYTIRPALTRAQERRLEETSPDMEMAKLHMFGHRMILACARLNDWVRCMNQRQLIPLHIFLAGTVLADDLGHFGYNAVRKMGEGYEEWREDPHGYLECIPSSDVFEEDERSSSSESNPWEEEDRAWSDGDEGWQQG